MLPALKAPPGKFRVIGKDGSQDPGWIRGDFEKLGSAKKAASTTGTVMYKIYDDKAKCVFDSTEN